MTGPLYPVPAGWVDTRVGEGDLANLGDVSTLVGPGVAGDFITGRLAALEERPT